MIDRASELDALGRRILCAEHFCTRSVHALDGDEFAAEAAMWMKLADFDHAPLAGSNGEWLIAREDVVAAKPDARVRDIAKATGPETWIDSRTPLLDALARFRTHDSLLVRHENQLVGILTRHDLASPLVSSYALARILDIERGLRRLYGSYSHTPVPDEPPVPTSKGAGQGEAPLEWSLSDVLNKVRKHAELRADLGYSSGTQFGARTDWIVALRNHLAHGRSLLALEQSPARAVARLTELDGVFAKVQDLLIDRPQLWDAFIESSVVEIGELEQVWAGPGAVAELPMALPVFVVSAQNPAERVLSDSENRRRHEVLGDCLRRRFGPGLREVVGRSRKGGWEQASWAISRITRAEACEVAARFGQRAIFELTDEALVVVSVEQPETPRRVAPRRR